MSAIGYVRVSTEDQAKEGVSLDNQKSKIVAYCQLKDLNLSEIIEDAGISAKNLKRPGVQRVLKLACKKQVDAIVFYKLVSKFNSTTDISLVPEHVQTDLDNFPEIWIIVLTIFQ